MAVPTTLTRRLFLAILAFCILGGITVRADELDASANFSRPYGEVGVPLQFSIRVSGSRQRSQPPDIQVDGLDFEYIGPQTMSQGNFTFGGGLKTTYSVTHVFHVTPQRAGDFTVPSLELEVDGQRLRTQPVALKVQAPGASGSDSAPVQAEVILSKNSAYVGEVVPVDVRLLFESQVRADLEELPVLEGDGFTKRKFGQPERSRLRREGREYSTFSFRTVITPARAGKINVGPGKAQCVVQIPRAQPNRRRSIFEDDWFNDPMSAFGRAERRRLIAPAAELTVKPLPAAGRPKSFSGAVGKFQLSVSGTPDHVKINDPLTMKISVTGEGNFERLTAPVLVTPEGWRAYPPTETFAAEDETGTRGTKTFEVAVIPEQKKTKMPVFELTFFDPDKEKYVTLRNDAGPLRVEGEPTATPAPRLSNSETPAAPQAPPAASSFGQSAPAAPADILGLEDELGPQVSLRPLYREAGFWYAQGVPLALLLAVGLMRRLPRTDSGVRQQRSAWQKERAEAFSRVRREQDRQSFYEAAGRALQLEGALRTGETPDAMDVRAVCERLPGAGEHAETVRQIFETRAEALYAGSAGASPEALSSAERERVLAALEAIRKGGR